MKDACVFEIVKNGAREGNRTLVTSLEGWSSTTELLSLVFLFSKGMGREGFEPP